MQFSAFSQYRLNIHQVDKDSNNLHRSITTRVIQELQTSFLSKASCTDYVYKLPSFLFAKGFPAASIDSTFYDSSSAHINLYFGRSYKWIEIELGNADKKLLESTGWNEKQFINKKVDFSQIHVQEKRMMDIFDNTGYPFAVIKLDSLTIVEKENGEEGVVAKWKITKGPLYHIDSIRVFGKVKIQNNFLQKYLGILKGSIYSRIKLSNITRRMLELPYLQEQQHWDVSMLGTGSVLNLYLQPKRSSQVNFLIGFLPGTGQTSKTQLTGDVNINLKNSLGSGESILVNWQQLQRQSPKLNLSYQQPYIFNSAFGIDFNFALLKRDSTFLQLDGLLGLQYLLSANQSGKIFIQNQRTYLLGGGIDTIQIKLTKQLPANIDVNSSSIGLAYEGINTNYRNNPRKGNELSVITSVGLKKVSRNNDISNLKDPGNPSFSFNSLYDSLKLNNYQLRVKVSAAHYFPMGKRSTLRNAVSAGLFTSENIFRNELFQIGGYRLLRGFNEESIYATEYAVLTEEFRYLVGINSNVFFFTDIGETRTHFQTTDFSNSFIGAGIGLAFETKFGLLNFSYAVGKRNDVKFDIREASKIHFGYVNYF